jgi:hypothetical protein
MITHLIYQVYLFFGITPHPRQAQWQDRIHPAPKLPEEAWVNADAASFSLLLSIFLRVLDLTRYASSSFEEI